ncbi:MAG: oxygen-independent coproporphyrinogen-3 oxidase [Candidatus Marinamargulisbacteria bacterium]|jgi:oxygen-independent coproporphyrinogen-3 oxidase
MPQMRNGTKRKHLRLQKVRESANTLILMKAAIYLHVPFCIKACPYCIFYKEPYDVDRENDYISAVCKEISAYKSYFPNLRASSLFIGGGTPNILTLKNLNRLLEKLHDAFQLSPSIEQTMEINPDHVTKPKMKTVRNAGINRISIGSQSFNRQDLAFLGRTHKPQKTVETVTLLRDLGFDNINLDLIFGLKHQTEKTLRETLTEIISIDPEHISTYALSIEKGSEFYDQQIQKMDPDTERSHFKAIRDQFSGSGYHQYEVSNFSKAGRACQHNMAYWDFSPYIGLGPGAHSFFKECRYDQPANLTSYIQNPIPEPLISQSFPIQPQRERKIDFIMSRFRLLETGLDIEEYNALFKGNFEEEYKTSLSKLSTLKLILQSKGNVRVTDDGLYLLDEILLDFID